MKFTIPIKPVSKKNSLRIVINPRTHKPFVMQSKLYVEYEKMVKPFIPTSHDLPINYPINLKCTFYMPTRRRIDLCNLEEAISDVLVKYGVLEDDNRNIVASYDGSRVLYDKESPRTEIEISKIKDYQQW